MMNTEEENLQNSNGEIKKGENKQSLCWLLGSTSQSLIDETLDLANKQLLSKDKDIPALKEQIEKTKDIINQSELACKLTDNDRFQSVKKELIVYRN